MNTQVVEVSSSFVPVQHGDCMPHQGADCYLDLQAAKAVNEAYKAISDKAPGYEDYLKPNRTVLLAAEPGNKPKRHIPVPIVAVLVGFGAITVQ